MCSSTKMRSHAAPRPSNLLLVATARWDRLFLCLALILPVGASWLAAPPAHALESPTPSATSDDPPSTEGDDAITVPATPTSVDAVAGDGSAAVSWTPPSDDGGTPVSSYVITAEPSGVTVTVDGVSTSSTVSSLENGVATSFTVSAVNAVGSGPPSDASTMVTPRGTARFDIRRQPARRVLYGSPSRVRVALISDGVGVPSQAVELWAKVRGSERWRRVASGRTGNRGRVTLRVTLRASARLRVRHPDSDVVASSIDLRRVTVAKRVSVAARRNRTRLGMPVVVRGRVAPGQPIGSRVRLQRRKSGSWNKVASGRMVTRRRYVIRWRPQRVGDYTLRVVKRPDVRRAGGKSSTWRHRVAPETAADIAKDIMRNARITLATVHVSGGGYLGSPHQNIADVARGRRARHSCHAGAPCGSTRVDLRLLRAVRDMGTRARLTVSEIVGGVHAGRSAHYSGHGLDITWVNGRHIGSGASSDMIVRRCRAYGAKQVLYPSNDPFGGHHNHVHCGWE